MGASLAIPAAGFRALERERRAFVPRTEEDLLSWAQEHCYVTEGPLLDSAGAVIRWSPGNFPLQQTPLEALSDRRWNRIVLMASPQAFGKTEALAKPALFYALAYRGVSAAYVAARLPLAVGQWKRKLLPAMLADPELSGLFFDNPDAGGDKTQRDFVNGTSLHFAGGESEGALSGFTTPVVVCDDVQAMPASLPGRGHPVEIAFARAAAFPPESRSLVMIGTAGTVEDYLWRTLSQSTLYAPFVPCPKCGTYQLLEWERLVFDQQDVAAARRDTVMRCAGDGCQHRFHFEQLDELLARHLWISLPAEKELWLQPGEGGTRLDPRQACIYPETDRNTNVAGFVSNGLYWPHGPSWGDHAANWIKHHGDPEWVKSWQQTVLNRPWAEPEIDEDKLTIEELRTHGQTGHAAGTVPQTADLLTVTVDVQSGYCYYLVRAWRRADGESWLIALGTVGRPLGPADESQSERAGRRAMAIAAGLDEVDQLCAAGWPVVGEHGEKFAQMHPVLGLIDRGYEPDVIAGWWAAKNRGIWRMIKGQKAGGRAELWPIRPRRDQRGRPWRLINVNEAKHILRRLLRLPGGEPGYWHFPERGLHNNTVRAYFRHITSERWRADLNVPRWEPVQRGAANHFLDCETYQISAARACGVQLAGFAAMVRASVETISAARDRPKRPPIRRRY